ncbi:MAG: Gfo/Idh/MocA family oxidoreductase, partial [Candidatus Hydrogenedentales bacterium]
MVSLKIGFIGTGFIAKFHARALQQVRDVELVGAVSPHSAPAFAEYGRTLGLGDVRAFKSVKELCEACDVAAIMAPNYVRVELMGEVVDAVKAGAALKAVVCEKPLGRTVKEARRLVDMAKSANLRTCYFENQLHMKVI